MSATQTTLHSQFTSARGNAVDVFQVRQVGRNTTGVAGLGETVRLFAQVNGTELDLEPGCAFTAPTVVAAAGL